MGKKSRNKNRTGRKQRRRDEFFEKLNNFKENFPLLCKHKTLSEIIDSYCELMKLENSKQYYKSFYTFEELKSIYDL